MPPHRPLPDGIVSLEPLNGPLPQGIGPESGTVAHHAHGAGMARYMPMPPADMALC